MNEKVQAYLEKMRAEEANSLSREQAEARAQAESYKKHVLRQAGLVEKVYAPDNMPSEEYPFVEYNPDGENRHYKRVYAQVTDEEFAEIERYVNPQDREPEEKESDMFLNIGQKIQTFAKTLCWCGVVVCILLGFIMMISDEELVLSGLVTAGLGSIGSWIGSLFLYGFGEIIMKVNEIAENTKK